MNITLLFFLFSCVLRTEFEKVNYISKKDLRHIQNNKYIIPLGENKYRVFLRARRKDISRVYFIYYFQGKKTVKKMDELGSTRGKQYFYTDIESKEGYISYLFHLKDASYNYYFAKKSSELLEEVEFLEYQLKDNKSKPFKEDNLIIYQIFIDRFRNGDVDNDPIFNQLSSQKFLNLKEETISGKDKCIGFNWAQDGLFFKRGAWNSSWSKELEWEIKFKEKNEWYDMMFRHYGGDLRGIIEKLDYIKTLEVNTIYLSPPFYSKSNHKFDVIDLEHISPDFGHFIQTGNNYGFDKKVEKDKNEFEILKFNVKDLDFKNECIWTQSDLLFSRLIKEAHKRGLKVIINLPLTHISKNCKFFQHVMYHGPNSKYSNWFIFEWNKFKNKSENNINEWNPLVLYNGSYQYGVIVENGKKYRRAWTKPSENLREEEIEDILKWNEQNTLYKSFDNNGLLPLFNLNDENLRKYLINIIRKWLLGPDEKVTEDINDDGIDGFSFDTKDEMSLNFWNYIKDSLIKDKKVIMICNPLIINSKNHSNSIEMLSDLVYNYRFMPSILKAVNDKSHYRIENLRTSLELAKLRSYNPVINVLSTWDTERAYSSIINYNSKNRSSTENSDYKNIDPKVYDSKSECILKIAISIQMTYYGIALIYYGDEVGMFGSADPHNRKPMIWKDLLPYDKESDSLIKYSKNIKNLSVDIDEANQKIFYNININENIQKHFNDLLRIRKNFRELFSKGIVKFLSIKNVRNVFLYKREHKKEILITVVNFSDKEEDIEIPVSKKGVYKNLLKEGEEYNVYSSMFKLKVPSLTSKLLYSK